MNIYGMRMTLAKFTANGETIVVPRHYVGSTPYFERPVEYEFQFGGDWGAYWEGRTETSPDCPQTLEWLMRPSGDRLPGVYLANFDVGTIGGSPAALSVAARTDSLLPGATTLLVEQADWKGLAGTDPPPDIVGKAVVVTQQPLTMKRAAVNAEETVLKGYFFGEPHFLGFDGVEFEFHGKESRYLLFQDESIRIVSEFAYNTDPRYPLDYTFVSALDMRLIDGKENRELRITAKEPLPDSPLLTHERDETKVNKTEALVAEARFIEGEVLEIARFDHGGYSFLVSRMIYGGSVHHLNMGISGDVKEATGIMGQTCLPPALRKPNESFEIFSATG